MSNKEEFWLQMDLRDLEEAGAFVPKEIWDEFILSKPKGVKMTPRDYTK